MASDDKEEMLKQITEARGYTLEMHRIMAEVDMDWVTSYNQFIDATYTGQRLLDRKTKELLQVAVETALRADIDQIQAHIRVAIREGATPMEVLEAMQCVIMPMGALAYRRGLQAWSAETGIGLEK
ncbi:MAG: carboxymuconolactone decarboxylase family protein [Chloroflexi bacterium]|nr:carboxymuconolactone decarboxylase family protein [Chloroflexota bacterium]MCI0789565.1 carboxymuconolactone decarboxylase family protein [Chloroflexota bacterium]MCI0802001.1 carboxymuconolactone decarboxylase family protein [Chloroflexota bacterium]MCI0811974.1 carboxymuconolactone decarboxylase family protein [Chloroflexota bacterium]MCI0848120.1 carboxymuconolactone decarboxylase family protein [Chloroflexota bacterium]